MSRSSILGITTDKLSKQDILEKIKKYISQAKEFIHIVSLNPENLVVARDNSEFSNAIGTAQIKIIDGVGVVAAARVLGVEIGGRLTGIELMGELVTIAKVLRLRVLLVGGRDDLALRLAQCYQGKYPEAKFIGLKGFEDIKNPQKEEEEEIFAIVSRFKPHLLFAAFGSPEQELWLYRNRKHLKGIICMGVGGAFDVYAGKVSRAPVWMRKIGLEWLYRLLTQPWRWRRQLRLIKFLWLVIGEKFRKNDA